MNTGPNTHIIIYEKHGCIFPKPLDYI